MHYSSFAKEHLTPVSQTGHLCTDPHSLQLSELHVVVFLLSSVSWCFNCFLYFKCHSFILTVELHFLLVGTCSPSLTLITVCIEGSRLRPQVFWDLDYLKHGCSFSQIQLCRSWVASKWLVCTVQHLNTLRSGIKSINTFINTLKMCPSWFYLCALNIINYY